MVRRKDEEVGGPSSAYVTIRLHSNAKADLTKLVAVFTQKARDHGIPTTVTAAGLAQSWLEERIAEEMRKARKTRSG